MRYLKHQEIFDSKIVFLLGNYQLDEDNLERLTGSSLRHLILIAEHLPEVVHQLMQRVRTTSAGVEEAVMLAHELDSKGASE